MNFTDLVRNYLWKYMMWRERERFSLSFNHLYNRVRSDINYILRGQSFYDEWTNFDERIEIGKQLLEENDREIKEIIEELLLKMNKKKTNEQIRQISARAILEPILDESCLKYYIEYQKNGVKINLQLLPKKKASLYMSYGRLMSESDKLLDNILIIKQMYEYFGSNSGIVNINKEEMERFK